MMKAVKSVVIAGAITLVAAGSAQCGNDRQVIPSTVSGYGEFFSGGWEGGMKSDLSSITDGVFMPRKAIWNVATVWWDDAMDEIPNTLTVSFGREQCVKRLIVQSDGNDDLLIKYNTADGEQEIFVVPDKEWGLNEPITYKVNAETDAFTIMADPTGVNDGLFSISEVKVIGGKQCKGNR